MGVNCPFNFSFLLLTCVIDFPRLAFCGHRGLSFGSLTNTGPIHSTIDNTGGNGTDCVLAAAGHKLPSQLKSSSPHTAPNKVTWAIYTVWRDKASALILRYETLDLRSHVEDLAAGATLKGFTTVADWKQS